MPKGISPDGGADNKVTRTARDIFSRILMWKKKKKKKKKKRTRVRERERERNNPHRFETNRPIGQRRPRSAHRQSRLMDAVSSWNSFGIIFISLSLSLSLSLRFYVDSMPFFFIFFFLFIFFLLFVHHYRHLCWLRFGGHCLECCRRCHGNGQRVSTGFVLGLNGFG